MSCSCHNKINCIKEAFLVKQPGAAGRGGGGGVLNRISGREVRPGRQTLTIFKTRTSDFPTLLKTECRGFFLYPL